MNYYVYTRNKELIRVCPDMTTLYDFMKANNLCESFEKFNLEKNTIDSGNLFFLSFYVFTSLNKDWKKPKPADVKPVFDIEFFEVDELPEVDKEILIVNAYGAIANGFYDGEKFRYYVDSKGYHIPVSGPIYWAKMISLPTREINLKFEI